jgi:hypothetical protein
MDLGTESEGHTSADWLTRYMLPHVVAKLTFNVIKHISTSLYELYCLVINGRLLPRRERRHSPLELRDYLVEVSLGYIKSLPFIVGSYIDTSIGLGGWSCLRCTSAHRSQPA